MGRAWGGEAETTAMAALAMLRGDRHPSSVRGALAWLIAHRDSSGAWHSTQATVLAFKALLAGTGKPLAERQKRMVSIGFDGKQVRELAIPANQADVVQQHDLSALLAAGPHKVTLSEHDDSATVYQFSLSYYLPESDKPRRKRAALDSTRLR